MDIRMLFMDMEKMDNMMRYMYIRDVKLFTWLVFIVFSLSGCRDKDSQFETEQEFKARQVKLQTENDRSRLESTEIVFDSIKVDARELIEEVVEIENDTIDNFTTTSEINRKLRYLFCSNGGMIGYFDDGTISSCPRCDCIIENVSTFHHNVPYGTYKVESDGSLLIDGETKEYPNAEDRDWILINYRWQRELYK